MNLETVYTTDNAADGEMVRLVLEQNGIRAEVVDEGQAGLAGVNLVKVKVLVREDDREAALRVVTEYEHGSDE